MEHRTRSDHVTLSWNDLSIKSGEKTIIRNISGTVKPGTLLAIMGSSGAGKSTFMNVIANRNLDNLSVEGDIRVNDINIGDNMASISAYVQQIDIFVGSLTVQEHLTFHAALQMPRASKRQRYKRINELIDHFGLSKCADTLIGFPGISKTISGGEMKRLSLATELITNPPVIFCDEPTSGLDSFLAEIVVESLAQLAANGTTILCTIHQPSSKTFSLFSHLLLLAQGDVAYMGDIDATVDFFAHIERPVPSQFNPCDHYLSVIAIVPGKEDESLEKLKVICEMFRQYKSINLDSTLSTRLTDKSQLSIDDKLMEWDQRAGFFTSFRWLFWRCIKQQYLDAEFLTMKLVSVIATSFILGLIFLRIPWDGVYTYSDVRTLVSALFVLVTCFSTCFLFNTAVEFPLQMPVLKREIKSKYYSIGASYAAEIMSSLIIVLVAPLVFVPIVYFIIGFAPNVYKAFECYCINVMVLFATTGCGYFVSAISNSMESANIIAPAFLVPFFLYSGFFIKFARVPIWFYPVQFLSWFYYGSAESISNITKMSLEWKI